MLDATPTAAFDFAVCAPRRVGEKPARADLPLPEIVAYIRRNVGRRIALAELAALARVSVFQLCRASRRQCQITPHRLVIEIRLEHATRLIASGASLAEAAHAAGFADQSHFTRHFRRLRGVTPKRYARAGAPDAPRAWLAA